MNMKNLSMPMHTAHLTRVSLQSGSQIKRSTSLNNLCPSLRPTLSRKSTSPFTHNLQKQPTHRVNTRIATTQTTDVSSTATTQPTSVSNPNEPFNWNKHWYPVAVADFLDHRKPQPIELLGKQMVVWQDGMGEWRVFEDRCPHRAAPLSEGKIMDDGTLQCSYHGWRFEGETGGCTKVPQASDAESEKRICSGQGACATAYPTKTGQGLLFVWPESGAEAEAEAEATPLPLDPYLTEALAKGDKPVTFVMRPTFRDLPYDFSTLVENVADPAHVPYSHHGVQGNREKVTHGMYEMELKTDPERPHDVAVSYSSNFGPGTLAFKAPCNLNYLSQYKDGSYSSFYIFCVPTKPGFSRLISFITTTRKLPPMFKLLGKMPLWMDHTQIRNKVLDGDNVFLHYQEHFLQKAAEEEGKNWNQVYHMPTKADTLVIAFRKWLDDKGKSGPFGPLYKRKDYPPLITDHRVLLNRYEQHTKNCRACTQALGKIKALQLVTAAAAAVAWGALLVSGVQWVSSQASAATATAVVVGGLSVKATAAAMALLGTTFTFFWKVLDNYKQSFYYVPYVHAEK